MRTNFPGENGDSTTAPKDTRMFEDFSPVIGHLNNENE